MARRKKRSRSTCNTGRYVWDKENQTWVLAVDPAKVRHGPKDEYNSGTRWPVYSDAAGVHPSQIPEAMAESRRLGVPIDYTKSGRAIFTSTRHQREYLRKIGMSNRADFLA